MSATKPEMKRLRVTLVYEYDVRLQDYPGITNPFEMAELDINQDAVAAVANADEWTLKGAEFA